MFTINIQAQTIEELRRKVLDLTHAMAPVQVAQTVTTAPVAETVEEIEEPNVHLILSCK